MYNLYNPTSRSKQTSNFRPQYSDNPNAYMDYEIAQSQYTGLNLATENPIGAGIVNAIVNGVIGDGLKLETFIDKTLLKGVKESEIAKIQETIEGYWKVWSSTPNMCDHYAQDSLAGIETIALRSIIAQGDGLLHVKVVKNGERFYPQIQWIDGSKVATPLIQYNNEKILSGVEVDEQGRDVAYWVKQVKNNSLDVTDKSCVAKSKYRDYNNFTLVKFNEIQQGMARGVSLLNPVKDLLIQLDRHLEAELTKAILQSYMTFFITQDKEIPDNPTNSVAEIIKQGAGAVNSLDVQESDSRDLNITLSPGAIYELEAGKNIVFPESKAPISGFKEFSESVLKRVGMGVNIPYDVLIKEFNSSYSSSQASLQEAARGWNNFRRDFVVKFMQPIYIVFVDCLVLQGLITCEGYEEDVFVRNIWRNAVWHGPHLLNIDPVKNIKYYNTAINAGLMSREQAEQELTGGDWNSTIKRLGKEKKIVEKELPVDKEEQTDDSKTNEKV